jgi:glutamate--cysteine ligase
MITKKDHLIEYFKSGIKNTNEFKIGIEHEKFIFDLKSNKRIDS